MADLKIIVAVSFEFAGLTIEGKTFTMTTPVPGSGLTNAQAASAALQTEIATYIKDVATALTNALAGGDPDTDVQAIADQLTADASTLASADPVTNPVTPTPPTA